MSSATAHSRQGRAIRLGPYHSRGQIQNSRFQINWPHHASDLVTNEGTSKSTAVTTMKGGDSDFEPDDRLLTNINVQHDVHVDRGPRSALDEEGLC